MRGRKRRLTAFIPLVGVIAACGVSTHQAKSPKPVEQTHAYKQGYGIGYDAVLRGESPDCKRRSARQRSEGRLKNEVDVHRFVTGCKAGAHDATLTE
jgi:hypothetical protein